MNEPENLAKPEMGERMDADHVFSFECSPGISCFTQCCSDVTIVLTPYDVLRLKNALGITSGEFLDTYTLIIPKGNLLIPMVVLKMNEDNKNCQLVTEEGCSVYKDRPWACRMYPLSVNDDGTFSTIADRARCMGLSRQVPSRISEWLIGQGLPIYEEINTLFSQITAPLKAQQLDIDNPQVARMTFMALYNLDSFKEFVLKSSFLDKFHVEPLTIEKIKRSDTELLKFSFDWIKFGLFGQKLFSVKKK
jgi:Fe-S-cluster containining protein